MVIDGCGFDLKNTDKICIHALPSILHYAVALREGVEPKNLVCQKTARHMFNALTLVNSTQMAEQ